MTRDGSQFRPTGDIATDAEFIAANMTKTRRTMRTFLRYAGYNMAQINAEIERVLPGTKGTR